MVDAGGAGGDEAHAEGVGTVLGDDFHGVDDVAFGLGHFLAFFVENHAVEVDFMKWNIVGGVETEHDHAADPLEEEVGAGFHNRGGIVVGVGEGGDDGPLTGGKPGVEGVFVAGVNFAVNFDLLLIDASVENPVPCSVMEGGDGDAPRDLARDIPIFEVF